MTSFLVTIDQSCDYKLANVEKAAARILSNYPEFIDKIRGSRILLKPNLLSPDPPEKLTCTHPAVVEAIIRLIIEYRGRPALGDRPVKGNARKVARATGILKICERYNVPVIEFKKYRKAPIPPKKRFSSLRISRELDDFDLIINRFSQRVLTHIMIPDRDVFAELLIHACQNVRPAFTLVDGILAMQSKGPRGGAPYRTGVLVGGENPYCVDAAIAKILDMKTESIPILKVAQRLGIFDPDQVKTNGYPDILYPDFKLPQLQPVSFSLYRSGKIFLRQLLSAMFKRFRKKMDINK
jgi:uncharacterized protein (DUF362 family)